MRTHTLIAAAVLIVSVNVLSAHGIDVSLPEAKAVWTKGSQQKIRWQVGKVEEVHIELIQVATKKRLPVVKSLKNSGAYEWKVAADVEPGQYKVLVISTKDEEVHGVSAIFEIR